MESLTGWGAPASRRFPVSIMGRRIILGCGYVGSEVARDWLEQGHEVWAVSRNQATLEKLLGPRFHPVVARVESADWHHEVPGDAEVLLNCVAAAGGGLEGYQRSYLGGNRSLLNWTSGGGAGRMIYTSSTGVYPFADGREVTEDMAGGGELSPTGQVVHASEQLLRRDPFVGPRATILRLAGIYGPHRHYLLDLLRDGAEVLPGRGDVYLNMIHLEDIVGAIHTVSEHPAAAGEIFNLCDNEPSPKEEMVRWLSERLGREPPRFDPESARGRRMRVNARGESPNRRILNHKIRETLGWEPRYPSFREGYGELRL